MKIYARLERWVLTDGNYEDFHKDDKCKLAFYLYPKLFLGVPFLQKESLTINSKGEISSIGRIIFESKDVLVISCYGFKFFIEKTNLRLNLFSRFLLKHSKYIKISGNLLLDYYIWNEQYKFLEKAPDIYYECEVKRIERIIPSENNMSVLGEDGKYYHPKLPKDITESKYIESTVLDTQDLNSKYIITSKPEKIYLSSFYTYILELETKI